MAFLNPHDFPPTTYVSLFQDKKHSFVSMSYLLHKVLHLFDLQNRQLRLYLKCTFEALSKTCNKATANWNVGYDVRKSERWAKDNNCDLADIKGKTYCVKILCMTLTNLLSIYYMVL